MTQKVVDIILYQSTDSFLYIKICYSSHEYKTCLRTTYTLSPTYTTTNYSTHLHIHTKGQSLLPVNHLELLILSQVSYLQQFRIKPAILRVLKLIIRLKETCLVKVVIEFIKFMYTVHTLRISTNEISNTESKYLRAEVKAAFCRSY